MVSTGNAVLGRPLLPDLIAALPVIFQNLHDGPLLARLWLYRANSRPGYPIQAMFRAYVASFILNMGSTNDLIRRLEGDPVLRRLCGFGKKLPHRTTFNRFIARLSRHLPLVEEAQASAIDQLQVLLPDLGAEVAIDSTTVRTHANPNRRTPADPEASWTAKNSAKAKEGGKEWHYGYKLHMVTDANHGIPLGMIVTTASRNDSPELPPVMERTRERFPWFRPRAAIADRGYDATSNYAYLRDIGTVPVILNRRNRWGEMHDDIYTKEGVPTCVGGVEMGYVRTDPETGHRLYQCVGCHLATRRGVHYCDDTLWVDPASNIRLFGVLRRDSAEWKELYVKRQSVERTFKGMKQSRRLERHHVRGLRQITLHCLMAALTYTVTALVNAQQGALESLTWMVPKVA